jgi:hypothetical protein
MMTTFHATPALRRVFPLLASLSLLANCSEPNALKGGAPSAMIVISGGDQSGVVGQELPMPLVVRVNDADGDPVPNQVVNFKVTSGGGSVFAGVALTNASGEARERWTLGTVSGVEQRVQARAIDQSTGEALVFADFAATSTVGPPASITANGGAGQTVNAGARASDSLVVVVRDSFGNPISDATVTWSVASGGGQVSPASSQTNASGETKTAWTVGTTSGVAQQVVATVASLTTQFDATAVSGAPAQLVLVQMAAGAQVGKAFAQQPVVRVTDALGNTVSTASTVSMSVGSGATISGTGSKASLSGIASYTDAGLQGVAGSYTLTFSSTVAGTVLTVSQSITLAVGEPTDYVLTSSVPSAVVGSSVQIEAQLKDASGNAVNTAGRTVSWGRSGNGGTFNPATSVTDASGKVATTLTLSQTRTAGSVWISATDESSLKDSINVIVTTGPATKLVFDNQPADVGFDRFFYLTVRVVDDFNNTVTNDSRLIDLDFAASDPSLESWSNPPATAATNGVVTFPAMIFKPGDGFTITAVASGLTSAVTAPFSVARVAVLVPASSLPAGSTMSTLVFGSQKVWYTHSAGANQSISLDVISFRGDFPARSLLGQVTNVASAPSRMIFSSEGLAMLVWIQPQVISGKTLNGAIRIVKTSTGGISGGGLVKDLLGPDLYVNNTFAFVMRADGGGAIGPWSSDPNIGDRRVFAAGGSAYGMLLASDLLYYFDNGALKRVSWLGGTATTLAANANPSSNPYAGQIALTGGNIYYVGSGGTIRMVSATTPNQTPSTLVSGLTVLEGETQAHHLVPDGNWMYFIDAGSVRRFRLVAPFDVEDIALNEGAVDMTVDPAAPFWAGVYWVGTGGLKKWAKLTP